MLLEEATYVAYLILRRSMEWPAHRFGLEGTMLMLAACGDQQSVWHSMASKRDCFVFQQIPFKACLGQSGALQRLYFNLT